MSPIAVLISAVIGILVMIQSRKWFFGSDEDFWKGFGSKFDPEVFPRSNRNYQKYLNDKDGQLTVITWLMTGTLSALLAYALFNLLFS